MNSPMYFELKLNICEACFCINILQGVYYATLQDDKMVIAHCKKFSVFMIPIISNEVLENAMRWRQGYAAGTAHVYHP